MNNNKENNSTEVKVEKRGRPVNPESPRQKRLAEQAARKVANGGTAKRGRPVSAESERQQRIAERESKIAAGVEIKRGRPVSVKPVNTINIEVVKPIDIEPEDE